MKYYTAQFATTDDFLHVALPQHEIIEAMLREGEHKALNDLCISVAVVADAIADAQLAVVDDLD